MTIIQVKNKKAKKGDVFMKKGYKKILCAVFALMLILSVSLTAFAADITAEEAKSIALSDAGYTSEQVKHIYAEYDVDDGRKHWNVDFLVEDSQGRLVDYDYEISASDGRILEKDREFESDRFEDSFENIFERFIRQFVEWLRSLFA